MTTQEINKDIAIFKFEIKMVEGSTVHESMRGKFSFHGAVHFFSRELDDNGNVLKQTFMQFKTETPYENDYGVEANLKVLQFCNVRLNQMIKHFCEQEGISVVTHIETP